MSRKNIQAVIRHDSLFFMAPGNPRPITIFGSHPNFSRIIDALHEGDLERAIELSDPLLEVNQSLTYRIEIRLGRLYFDGVEMDSRLSRRIISDVRNGIDCQNWVNFLEKLMENPDPRAILMSYDFIEENSLPITQDGEILAYKSVRDNYYDHHSGSVYYGLGEAVEMPREEVCDDPEQTCAPGLHVCSIGYLKDHLFGGDGKSLVVLMKIHPRDLVSIPSDYKGSKVRCCRLKVVGEFKVSTGKELKKIDDAIRSRIDKLGVLLQNTSLSEDALRELIGVIHEPEDPIVSIGSFGSPVAILWNDEIHHGYLVGAIAPAENAQAAIMRYQDRFAQWVSDLHDELGLDDIYML